MLGALIMLVVLPFIPGSAPLMFAAAVGGAGAAGVFAWHGMPGDAAKALVVVVFALAVRALRLRWVARRVRP